MGEPNAAPARAAGPRTSSSPVRYGGSAAPRGRSRATSAARVAARARSRGGGDAASTDSRCAKSVSSRSNSTTRGAARAQPGAGTRRGRRPARASARRAPTRSAPSRGSGRARPGRRAARACASRTGSNAATTTSASRGLEVAVAAAGELGPRAPGSTRPRAPRGASSRFETPGLLTGSNRISRSVSVTADLIFFAVTDGSSSSQIMPSSVSADLRHLGGRILQVVDLRGLLQDRASGTTKVSPNRELNRCARSRVSSMCWRWSSPTGTTVAS